MVFCRCPLLLAPPFAFSVMAAGCGGGGGTPRVASVASSTTTVAAAQNSLLPFSECMRAHGVPSFPDPSATQPRALKEAVSRLAVGNPRFPAAQRACGHLLPNGGGEPRDTAARDRARLGNELSFAKCMRRHGEPRFPDPTGQGGLSVEMVQAQGIDIHSPAVLRVVRAC